LNNKNRNLLIPAITLVSVVVNGLLSPVLLLVFSIVLLPFCVVLLYSYTTLKSWMKIIFILFILILDDVLVRAFSNTGADAEGNAVIILFFFMDIIPVSIIIIYNYMKRIKEEWLSQALMIITFTIILFIYYSNFNNYGMHYSLPPSSTIEISDHRGMFVEEYQMSANSVVLGQDTIKFKSAWVEQEKVFNHEGLYKKEILTNKRHLIANYETGQSSELNLKIEIEPKIENIYTMHQNGTIYIEYQKDFDSAKIVVKNKRGAKAFVYLSKKRMKT